MTTYPIFVYYYTSCTERGICVLEDDVVSDIRFLLSFVPAESPDQVEPGLIPMTYLTGSYEGDVKLARRVENIRDKYGIESTSDIEELISEL